MDPQITSTKFVRLVRVHTESYLTYELPWAMPFETACDCARSLFPNWEVLCGSLINPDEI